MQQNDSTGIGEECPPIENPQSTRPGHRKERRCLTHEGSGKHTRQRQCLTGAGDGQRDEPAPRPGGGDDNPPDDSGDGEESQPHPPADLVAEPAAGERADQRAERNHRRKNSALGFRPVVEVLAQPVRA